MRSLATGGVSATLVGDIWGGGVMVECQCGETHDVLDNANDIPLICTCGEELVHRPWFEW